MVAGLDIMEEREQTEARWVEAVHTENAFCPLCGFALQNGRCPYKCLDDKPAKTCKIHMGQFSDFAHRCHNCSIDYAALRRWETKVGLRCEVCGNRLVYCECCKAAATA